MYHWIVSYVDYFEEADLSDEAIVDHPVLVLDS